MVATLGLVLFLGFLVLILGAALFMGIAVVRDARKPRPALPESCGDCVFMIPKARIYRRETIEDEDGLIHYLCQQRWIEVTPVSPRCSLGKSRTRLTTQPN